MKRVWQSKKACSAISAQRAARRLSVRFGRAIQRRGRAFAIGDNLGDEIEVAGADFALVFRRRVTIAFRGEFRLLQSAYAVIPRSRQPCVS